MHADPMHSARLALLEGAACSLLRAAAQDLDENHIPDGMTVYFTADGLDIEYTRGGMPVHGEGV